MSTIIPHPTLVESIKKGLQSIEHTHSVSIIQRTKEFALSKRNSPPSHEPVTPDDGLADASDHNSDMAARYTTPCSLCTLQAKNLGREYPCLKMSGGRRAAACYACRMRKRVCGISSDAPTEWVSIKSHPVDDNRSSKESPYFGLWVKMSKQDNSPSLSETHVDDQDPITMPDFLNEPAVVPTPRKSALDIPHDVFTLHHPIGDDVIGNPNDIVSLSQEIPISGRSEASCLSMEICALYWTRYARVPTSDELEEILGHFTKRLESWNPNPPRPLSNLDRKSHAMELLGHFVSKEGRRPRQEELHNLLLV